MLDIQDHEINNHPVWRKVSLIQGSCQKVDLFKDPPPWIIDSFGVFGSTIRIIFIATPNPRPKNTLNVKQMWRTSKILWRQLREWWPSLHGFVALYFSFNADLFQEALIEFNCSINLWMKISHRTKIYVFKQ